MQTINSIDGRHKPMNIQLQTYLISLWMSYRFKFVEDIDIDSTLRLSENWSLIRNMGSDYVW